MNNTNCIYYDGNNQRCLHPYADTLACTACGSAISEPVLRDCTSFVRGKCRRKIDECIKFGEGPDGRCAFCEHYKRRSDTLLDAQLKRERTPPKKRKRPYVKRMKG